MILFQAFDLNSIFLKCNFFEISIFQAFHRFSSCIVGNGNLENFHSRKLSLSARHESYFYENVLKKFRIFLLSISLLIPLTAFFIVAILRSTELHVRLSQLLKDLQQFVMWSATYNNLSCNLLLVCIISERSCWLYQIVTFCL